MRKLLLYIAVTDSLLNLPPEWLSQINGVVFSEMDSRSDKEVVMVNQQAMERSEEVILFFDVKNEDARLDKLYPLLKTAVKVKDRSFWLQSGHHSLLDQFRKKFRKTLVTDDIELIKETINSIV